MKRSRILGLLAASLLLAIAFPIARQAASYFKPITAQGKYVLLRLEDVGPGNFYGTPEGLGKLRAVLDYLGEQKIPYHITVVSRWKSYSDGKGWEEAGIDTPTPMTESFVKILKDAQNNTAVLGMHGYSHQFGDVVRADGQHNSGFANEFKIKGEPSSEKEEYAGERIEKSLAAFEKNGLFPAFWETPHYNASYEQHKVFRSYMGIIYEPNWYEIRSLKDTVYLEDENHWKKDSLGAVYVPAPLKYVASEESVQQILAQLKDCNSLASMYFHPFLEFKYLEPVQENGAPVLRDGIPVFRYNTDKRSPLHQLVEGIKQTNYTFGTIHDVVPFTPAHRIQLMSGLGAQQIATGDLNGDKKTDWIEVDQQQGRIIGIKPDLKWPRNTTQPTNQQWLQQEAIKQDGTPLLVKHEGSERSDLLWITNGQALLFKNEGDHFAANAQKIGDAKTLLQDSGLTDQWQWSSSTPAAGEASTIVGYNQFLHRAIVFQVKETGLVRIADISLPQTLAATSSVLLAHVNSDNYIDVIAADPDSRKITVWTGNAAGFEKPAVWGQSDGVFVAGSGDTNGDGLADMVFYNEKDGTWQVQRSTGNNFEKLPAEFGPWARQVYGKPHVGDFDGNGKTDIGIYNEQTGNIDIALSYQK